MILRIRKQWEIDASQAQIDKDWPGIWQTHPLLIHLRANIPDSCSTSWQKQLAAMGPARTLAMLKQASLSWYDIETLPMFAQEIHFLTIQHPILKERLPEGLLDRQVATLPVRKFIACAKHWNKRLSQSNEPNPENTRWQVPIAGEIPFGTTRIQFCSSERDVLRAIRPGWISCYTWHRWRLIKKNTHQCLRHHAQLVVFYQDKQLTSVLQLTLHHSTSGYSYEIDWHRPCNSTYGTSHFSDNIDDPLSTQDLAARDWLITHLNRLDNQNQLARIYAQTEQQRESDGEQRHGTLGYLTGW